MRRWLLGGLVAGVALLAGIALAAETFAPRSAASEAPQRRRNRGGFGFYGGLGPPTPSPDLPIDNMPYAGKFTFLRLRFDEAHTRRGNYAWGLDMGWNHDYPRAEYNLSMMLDELTMLPITIDERGGNIYSFSDPQIFAYPFVYISEPGYWIISDEEVDNLRAYLQKGGFLMVDDMEGDDTQAFFEVMQRVFPGTQFIILDNTHPIFNCFFQIKQEDLLHLWYRSSYGNPVTYGVFEDNDPSGRLLAVVGHDEDIGESWEFSNLGYVPAEEANESYKIGMNYVLCSMLH